MVILMITLLIIVVKLFLWNEKNSFRKKQTFKLIRRIINKTILKEKINAK